MLVGRLAHYLVSVLSERAARLTWLKVILLGYGRRLHLLLLLELLLLRGKHQLVGVLASWGLTLRLWEAHWWITIKRHVGRRHVLRWWWVVLWSRGRLLLRRLLLVIILGQPLNHRKQHVLLLFHELDQVFVLQPLLLVGLSSVEVHLEGRLRHFEVKCFSIR